MTKPNLSPLDSLYSNFRLDQTITLNLAFYEDNYTNQYVAYSLDTNYYDTKSYTTTSLNISRPQPQYSQLKSHHDHFLTLIFDRNNYGVNVIAIAVKEAWSISYVDLVQIPKFHLGLKTQFGGGGGGGVGFLYAQFS
jgi:hypothetical protein